MKYKKYFKILFTLFFSIVISQNDIKLYDYILVHGINSEASSWDNTEVESFVENQLKMHSITALDYRAIHHEHIPVIAQYLYNDFINSQQGDETIVITHSMGGLVARSFIEQYSRGKISTLITIGTPHLGANIATPEGEERAIGLITDLSYAAAEDIAFIMNNSPLNWFFNDFWQIFLAEGISGDVVETVYNAFISDLITSKIGVSNFNSGEDLSPGSDFLTYLNENSLNEEMVDRFSIRGIEDYPELYRYISSLIFGDDYSLVNFIDVLRDATIPAAEYAYSWMNYYYDLTNICISNYNYWWMEHIYWYNIDPYLSDYAYDNAQYWYDLSIIYYNNALFTNAWTQYLLWDHDKYTTIPIDWNNDVIQSDQSDGFVTSSSQSWPIISSDNQLVALGANHADERNNPAVIQRMETIAITQSLYPWQGYNENHYVPGDVNGDMELSILDVALLSNIILSSELNLTSYQEIISDVNSDGDVDILDIVQIVYMILNGSSPDYSPDGSTYVTKVIKQRGDPPFVMEVKLLSDVTVEGMQMTIDLDPGYKAVQVDKGVHAVNSDMTLAYSISKDSTSVKYLYYGPDGQKFPVGNGIILEIDMIYTGLNRGRLDPAAGVVSEIKITSNGAGYLDNQVVEKEEFLQLVNAFENPESNVPERFALHPAHPNPFNPVTTIRFDLPEDGPATLMVYDMMGREVTQLVNGVMSTGYHSVQWDASNLASGVYMVRLTAGDHTSVQKVSLLK